MTLTKPHPGPEIRIFVRDFNGAEMEVRCTAMRYHYTSEALGADVPPDDLGPLDLEPDRLFMHGTFIGEVNQGIMWTPQAAQWRRSWRYKVPAAILGVIRLASDRIRARVVHSGGTKEGQS